NDTIEESPAPRGACGRSLATAGWLNPRLGYGRNSDLLHPAFDECERRSLLYDGAIVVLSPNGAAGELCAFARDVLCDAFAGAHPQTAQYDMPIEAFAALIADVKSRFI